MPPKVKVTKKEIVAGALALVRERGEQAINARGIAAALGCSTQPVYSNFATMEALQQAVVEGAYEIYLGFIRREIEAGQYPRYKSFGMAYVRFAEEEKELFKLLFMCDRRGQTPASPPDFEASVEMIMQANGIARDKAELMHLEMWSCVHGIGTMLATSFLSLDWELISDMLSDIYLGLRTKYLSEDVK